MFKQVNVSFVASDNQQMVAFAQPKNETNSLKAGQNVFKELGYKQLVLRKNPIEHGANLWTVSSKQRAIGWIELS